MNNTEDPKDKQDTNAKGGSECADEIYPDDGRYTHGDPKEHKGNWGKHSDKDADDDDED